MAIKVKILRENKSKKSEKIDESIVDMLSDPVTLTMGAAGLAMVYQLLFGKKPDPDADLNRVRKEIEAKVAKAEAGKFRFPPPDGASNMQSIKAKQRLKKLKADREEKLKMSPNIQTDLAE